VNLLEELRKRSDYIIEKKHDTLPLLIFNYNQKCQIDGIWDEYMMMSRGLILDLEGNVIARPFKKFFGIGQRLEDSYENLPIQDSIVYEKIDGSLGIQFYDGDRVCIATRGSFNSEQAIHATKLMEKFAKNDFDQKYTYLYEIIYPQNRIVVNYDSRDELVLLAVIDTQTGEEGDFILEAKRLGFSHAKVYNKNLDELIELVKILPADDEGFVVKYTNNYRVKLKGVEYLRLHRLITGFSTKSIWECLMNGQSFDDVLTNVPDEFLRWCLLKKCELMDQFNQVLAECMDAYMIIEALKNRKTQAIEIMNNYKNISGEIFLLLDGKSPNKIIWKKLKPKYELPFFNQSGIE
jgi:hypothetical protein